MNNEQLIKSAHMWALGVVLLFGVIVLAGRAESNPAGLAPQNANSNTNMSRNQNANANTNRSRNANNSNASGEQTRMGALSSRDQKFMMEAATGGMMEVELGRWAAQKGTSDAIKQFGHRMVDDHSQANTELMQLASSKGVTVPTQLDEKHRNEVAKLTKLSGAEFDRQYAKMMISDHRKDVDEFQKQSMHADDADLQAFAAKTLPTLQQHLQMAQTLPGNEGKGKGNSNSNSKANSNANRP